MVNPKKLRKEVSNLAPSPIRDKPSGQGNRGRVLGAVIMSTEGRRDGQKSLKSTERERGTDGHGKEARAMGVGGCQTCMTE